MSSRQLHWVIIAVTGLAFCVSPAPKQPASSVTSRLVVVAPPRNAPDDLSAGIRSILEALLQSAGMPVLPSSGVAGLTDNALEPALMCARAGAQTCIVPEIASQGTGISIRIRWLDARGEVTSSTFNVTLRETSQGIQDAFVSMMDAASAKGWLETSDWSADRQLAASRMIRPQTETLQHFSRGLSLESTLPYMAMLEYRNALLIDPDFTLAYARLFYVCYESNPYSQTAEVDLLTQTRVRMDTDNAVWLALAFRDLGQNALRKGWLVTSDAYFRRSLAILANIKKETSIPGSIALHGLGDLGLKNRNSINALYHTNSAQQALESVGAQNSSLYLSGLLRLGAGYLLDNQTSLAVYTYEKARDLAGRLNAADSPEAAIIDANLGLARIRESNYVGAAALYESALARLRKTGYVNTELYLTILGHLGQAQRFMGNISEAEATFERVITGSKILGLNESMIQAEAMYSTGALSMVRGDFARAQVLMISAQMTMMRLGNQRNAADHVALDLMPVKQQAGMTLEEARLLSSYCGAFSYASHSRTVQARTYEGRLDDTNVFLRDLLDVRKSNDAALNHLREKFATVPDPSGRDTAFVDIGPAIANMLTPGVTAVSLARDFPGMQVVALDLPEQVEIFRTTVAAYLRSRVTAFPNMFILSGNGIQPMMDQFQNNANWFSQKQPRIPAGMPLVIRAANSVDIYESWETNAKAMDRIAKDFKASAILYLFNRSILFKPAGSDSFRIIGVLSPAGFDHMYETFNRQGDSAYTIFPDAVR